MSATASRSLSYLGLQAGKRTTINRVQAITRQRSKHRQIMSNSSNMCVAISLKAGYAGKKLFWKFPFPSLSFDQRKLILDFDRKFEKVLPHSMLFGWWILQVHVWFPRRLSGASGIVKHDKWSGWLRILKHQPILTEEATNLTRFLPAKPSHHPSILIRELFCHALQTGALRD